MAVSIKGNRNPGLDVLRALAMLFVICQHFLGQGGLVTHATTTGNLWFFSFLQILVYCSVNLYGIITGYLLCEKSFHLARLTKLWLTTVFWSVVVSCCFFLFVPESRTLSEAISMFLPILRGRYWFFTAYFVVMLVSPILNLLIRTLSRRQFHLLFAVLFLFFGIIPIASLGNDVLRISNGHHFSWLTTLYIIGGYIKKYGSHESTRPSYRYLLFYFLLAGLHLAYQFFVVTIGLENYKTLLLIYPSPFILGEALCLFLFFKDTFQNLSANSFFSKALAFISPGIYSIYIIHVHPLIFHNEKTLVLFRNWDSQSLPAILGLLIFFTIFVFVVCVGLDFLRQQLFRITGIDRTVDHYSDKLEALIRTYVR